MGLHIVTIGDCRVSSRAEDTLITYALGSCIAVVIFDKQKGVGGLLHILLPDSTLDGEKARRNPFTFADTGIPLLFQKAYELGACKQNLRVAIAGGSRVGVSGEYFQVGEANIAATRSILERANVPIHCQAVGGNAARTVRLHLGSGRLAIQQTEIGGLRIA